MRSGEVKVSLSTFLVTIVVMGTLQVLQLHYNYLRPVVPNQCDCQCTKQLHISGNNPHNIKLQNNQILSEDIQYKKGEVHMKDTQREVPRKNEQKEIPIEVEKEELLKRKGARSEDELKRLEILEAEDKALDREFSANKTKKQKDTIEDPEERSPYQPERIKSEKQPRGIESLVISPLDIDPNIGGSSLKCSPNLLLIYAYSAPGNFDEREIVRRSYGGVESYEGIKLKVLFFLGGLSDDKNTTRHYNQLLNESRKHGDLVLDRSYIDAYRNLTLKGISAIRWIHKYCPKVYRVMKVDDDTMINPYNLVTFLKGQSNITMGEIICKMTQGVGPIRESRSKYYVSEDEYSNKFYPQYCQGYGYIFPPAVLPKIIKGFQKNKLIAMEDVFITGITAGQTEGVRLHPLTALYSTTFTKFDVFLERITSRPELLLVGHVHKEEYVQVFWKLVKQRLRAKIKAEREEQAKKNKKEEGGDDDYSDYNADLNEEDR